MRNIFVAILFMLLIVNPALTQTRVEKKVATKATGYGVTYYLPKTTFVITVEITKTVCKAGPYYKYADLLLGIKDAVMEDNVSYTLGKVTLTNKGVPDLENTYIVEFKAGTVAPYVYLTSDGLLCAINTEYTPVKPIPVPDPVITQSFDMNVTTVYTEEFLKAGTVARQAEVAAQQIYHIRERKMDILTGDAENLPPDGEAMKLVIQGLENQEQKLTSLFAGGCSKETSYHEITLTPESDVKEAVLFRFSGKMGLLPSDDLGGEPVYFSLQVTERAPQLAPKEAEKKEKSMKGIIYNLPGKARVEIKTAKNTLYAGEVQVVQFGTQESLAPVMFEDKKTPVKVTFYPETGAIRQISQ